MKPRTLLVSRHPGAKRWLAEEAKRRGWSESVFLPHCRPDHVTAGDRVMGTLPVQLAAEICARGAEYWHLEVYVNEQDRGRELSFEELVQRRATLRRYHVMPWVSET